jgi:hypothetical protein
MRQRRLLLGCGTILLLLAGCVAVLFWRESLRGMTPHQVVRLVRRADLPPGTTRASVEDWLDSQQIRHDFTTDTGNPEGPLAYRPRLQDLCDLKPGAVAGIVRAKIRDAVVDPWWPWWNGEIWVYFFLDRDDKLISYVVKAWRYYL